MSHSIPSPELSAWRRGPEAQRQADLGNGFFLNPILAGDHADPSVLKDGDDYYLVHSSFFRYPGLLIWHSRDLVNWVPVGPALTQSVGSVWAPDLIRHGGRYYIYFPGRKPDYLSNYVVWADSIHGPWSDPIDLRIGRIDPGHAVAPDGRRYLFMDDGYRIELAADGLSVVGEMHKVYDGWAYPDEWVGEGLCQEGPKILRRGDTYYMVLAEGGTAGPPTSHMVVAARSKSLDGPWENSPHNPIVRTRTREEKWCSRGHATLVEGPGGTWYLVYHAYENGFYTLGRHTLLEPVVWTEDGWFKSAGHDVAAPIPKNGGEALPHGRVFSDDFSADRMGVQWTFHVDGAFEPGRYRLENRSLVVQGRGESPGDCAPLGFNAGDQAYQVEVDIELGEGARAGLILFYDHKLYAGVGFDGQHLIGHCFGLDSKGPLPKSVGRRLQLRLHNDRHIVSVFFSVDGTQWFRHPRGLEVSGYHHNVAGEFLSLRPALYAAGRGEVTFRNFKYQALP